MTAVIIPRFELESYLRTATDYRATHLHIVPPIAVQFAKSPLLDADWLDLSTVTGMTSGGAPLGPAVIREVYKRLSIPIKMGYGTSESGSITTMHGDTWDVLEPQLGSTGRPLYGVEIVVQAGDGKGKTTIYSIAICADNHKQSQRWASLAKSSFEALAK